MFNRERVIAEFFNLVKIDSLTFQEREMADYLKKKLEELGLEVYEDDAGAKYNANTGNIIGRLAGNKEGPALLFLAHMDRVEPGKGIKPRVEDDIIKSDGTTVLGGDDAAGIAAILEGLRVLTEKGKPHNTIEVVFTIAEEGGLFGAKALNTGKLESKMGFALDSNGDVGEMIFSGPAQDEIEITIRGKASHAGVAPEAGINAIQVAAAAINNLKLGRIDAETTSNIGIIKGGKATNIVPDTVEIKGETRSLKEERVAEETQKMAAAFARAAASLGATADFHSQRLYPAYKIEKDEDVALLAFKGAKKAGLKTIVKSSGGGSDANILNAKGIRCINLAVGPNKVHSTEEELAVANLVKAAELCYCLMDS
ncbi:MAG TPA: M20/M25/M40 family metallo-hydrolase [Firmicutes bacterium]|nr:M20/M25/M40 family metallo-hydrolase [Bacillota bacterium]